jgi:catechol 2,3-dioxygenase-like lactoylglutathione lyase family enzyme
MTRIQAKGLTPILNVSDIQESFAWFERLGWKKHWDWGHPPTFGAVHSGHVEIFLCHDGQGGRSKRPLPPIIGFDGYDAADPSVWMSIWVEDVDAVHRHCVEQNLEIVWPPTDMPWNVREMHVRHPDGHVFRISRGSRESRLSILRDRLRKMWRVVDVLFHGEATGTAAFLPSSIPRPSTIVAKTSAADVNSGTVFPK